jgi:Tfp pilus assembly protein FimT
MKNGFTLIEAIIAFTILTWLVMVSVLGYFSFQKSSNLSNNVQEFVSVLKLAQNKALASENSSKYGVYINTATMPNQFILFRGNNYASRLPEYDLVYFLSNSIIFSNVDLGSDHEIVFNRITGFSDQAGSVSLQEKTNASLTKIIYISNFGTISFNLFPSDNSLDSNRVKDSRHIEFEYNRVINTSNETINLNFNGSQNYPIIINNYLSGGQIKWRGTINVDGSNQIVEIDTIRLNNPDTLFSIYRDKRYNNKSLQITLSGDSSGYLANYLADGITTNPTSIYVTSFQVQ